MNEDIKKECFIELLADVLPDENFLQVRLIKELNHVYQVWTSKDQYFVKTYKKNWYKDKNLDEKGEIVRHEEYAFKLLTKHGLASPEVTAVRYDSINQLGRPFLMTRKLKGEKMTEVLSRVSYKSPVFSQILHNAGEYLKHMHGVISPYCGYVQSVEGREDNSDPQGWQHRSWSAKARQKDALGTLDEYKETLTDNTVRLIRSRLENMADILADEYIVNHFIHGDCHPHQFFVDQGQDEGKITGFVDLEVSGFGDGVEDLLKFSIEMVRDFPVNSCWWQPLFAGYGQEPDFEMFKLRLLGTSPKELKWNGTQEEIRKRMLGAKNWSELFDDELEKIRFDFN